MRFFFKKPRDLLVQRNLQEARGLLEICQGSLGPFPKFIIPYLLVVSLCLDFKILHIRLSSIPNRNIQPSATEMKAVNTACSTYHPHSPSKIFYHELQQTSEVSTSEYKIRINSDQTISSKFILSKIKMVREN